MKTLTMTTAVALAFALPAFAETAGFGPLLSPAELAQVLEAGDPLVLDIRPADDEGYAGGHLADAVSAPYGLFRGPEDNPGQLPSDADLTQVLRGLGVRADLPVVIVNQGKDATDFGAAARVYWTLKSSGVQDLAILNGGVNAWTEAGHALEKAPVAPQPSTIDVQFSHQWLATTEDVAAVVEGKDSALLLDARPESFWKGDQGHPAATKPGTLPQSKYFTHSGWFSSGPAIVDAEAAKRLAQENGLSESDQLISFCNTGHWAATNWFALSELAGVENVKLYPDSMVGWSNAGHEMANVPGVFRNLWNQVTSVF